MDPILYTIPSNDGRALIRNEHGMFFHELQLLSVSPP
jgi:hypothetical protein